MIIKFLVCSPAFATLQLLFAGTQAHREGTAVSQSLSNGLVCLAQHHDQSISAIVRR
jgi:hypothetical protein